MSQLLILVRHGESELNVANRTSRVFCGQFDSPLTERGRQQARAAALHIAGQLDLELHLSVSSALSRARETLDIMLERLGQNVRRLPSEPLFNERSLGIFENRDAETLFQEFPQYRDDCRYHCFHNDFELKAPGGENLTEVTNRACGALGKLWNESSENLLVVSHGVTIRCLLGKLLRLPNNKVLEMKVPNAVPIYLQKHSPEAFQLLNTGALHL